MTDNTANKINTLSALYALPTIRGIEALGIDAVEVVEFLARMNESGDVLPCVRAIQLLVKVTGQSMVDDMNSMEGNLDEMTLFADEFVADCSDILEEDMGT